MKSRKNFFLIVFLAILVFQVRTPSFAQAKTTVTVWYDSTGDSANTAQCIIDNVVKVFNNQSKTIEIKAELLPNAWDAVRTALAGGGAPDIVGTPGPSFAYDFAKAGYFAPIDDIATQYGWTKSFSPWALDLGKVDGKLYAVPAEVETMVLYYNKTLFDANKWPVPKTIDDLVALVKTIKAAGVIPFGHANAEWRPANEWFVTSMFSNIAGPQKVYDALTGKAKWDDPAFVKSLDVLNAWQKDGAFMGGLDKYYTATFNETHTAFGDGKAAMNMEGSWFMGSINTFFGDAAKNKNDWAWIPVPSADGKAIFPLGIGSTLSINAKAKDPKASGEVLNYIFSPETQARQFVKCGIAPAGVKLAPRIAQGP